jgi:hypothetical protein
MELGRYRGRRCVRNSSIRQADARTRTGDPFSRVSCGQTLAIAGRPCCLSYASQPRLMRNAGWSGAIRRSSSSVESGPTPPKKAPTSHFHFSR